MTGPFFILVEPQLGENIGAAARAMWNFGLRTMRVVNPRDGWPNHRAVALASGAGGVLDQASIWPTTAEAAECRSRFIAWKGGADPDPATQTTVVIMADNGR